MQYSVMVAKACPSINDVFITSDSNHYISLAGCKGIFRPPELARDDSRDVDYLRHAIDHIGCCSFVSEESRYIALLRPTTPFRSPDLVGQAITEFLELKKEFRKKQAPAPTSLRSVEEMSESAYKCYEMTGNLLEKLEYAGSCEHYHDKPNHLCPKTYKPNGYIDILDVEHIKTGNIWGNRIYGFLTPPQIEIDTENDFKMAEYELAIKQGGRWVFV